ncbi:NmrA-like family domain-containing oxidoreductase himF [Penicillium nucicola]|uniref:NmrA-like family domain-containing oxidoreductase himF n=1 Tax=Penicillium nucicola TaxID=1850975 RepID=UPI002545AFC5|nr:NmrA-like family domain-containing oxidoreductase himF [Penicillium nucicola]KAJ5766298.1 NmrA-like family domain-containing oxidoreductase himF [Penicillium nucicola]
MQIYPDDEAVQLGSKIIKSAEAAGVKHVVFSSAPYVSRLTNGKVSLNSLDVKAKIEEVGQAATGFDTFTPVMVGWYLEQIGEFTADLYGGFPVKEDSEGISTCRLPLWGGKEQMPWISIADDFGDIVHGIFLKPLRWNRRLVQCHADLLSAANMTTTYSAVTGKKTRFIPCVDIADMKAGIFDGVQNMFIYTQMRDGDYYPNGISEIETAAELKLAAFKAKRGKGRETLLTVREYFGREYGK